MATRKSALFLVEEASDSDSISITSSVASEPKEEYNVEKILAESHDVKGVAWYLVKWEGYDLYQSTWELESSFSTDLILHDWEQRKRLEEHGKAVAFDVQAFQDRVGQLATEKDDRHQRRKAKRRKLGIEVPPTDSEDEGGDPEDDRIGSGRGARAVGGGTGDVAAPDGGKSSNKQPKRKKSVKASPVKRKGVAQRVTAQKRTASPSSGDEESLDGGSSDRDLLFGEPRAKAEAGRSCREPRKSQSKQKQPTSKLSAAAGGAAAKLTVKATSSIKPGLKPSIKAAPTAHSGARKTAPSSTAAPRPTATAAKSKRAQGNVFANWTAEQPQRNRRENGETPKHFRNMAMQNSVRKQGLKRPAPDPDSLPSVDMRTGRIEVPKKPAEALRTTTAAPSTMAETVKDLGGKPVTVADRPESPAEHPGAVVTKPASGEIPKAYQRRTPPPAEGLRSASPHSPKVARAALFAATNRQGDAEPTPTERISSAKGMPNAPTRPRKIRETCHYWSQGECWRTADTCERYHTNELPLAQMDDQPLRLPKKDVTCYFWRNGICSKGDQECEFAHYDTGTYAPPPGAKATAGLAALPMAEALPQPATDTSGSGVRPPRETTCYYWRNGGCKKLDRECTFAHHDTGVYAGQPGTFKRGTMSTGFASPNDEVRNPSIMSNIMNPQRMAMLGQTPTEPPSGPERRPTPILYGMSPQPVQPPSTATNIPSSGLSADPRRREGPVAVRANEAASRLQDNEAASGLQDGKLAGMAAHGETIDAMNDELATDLATITHDIDVLERETEGMLLTAKGELRDGKVYLMMPKSKTGELRFLMDFFQQKGCQVYHSASPGGWMNFQGSYSKSSLLVVHPETPLWKIPKLPSFLQHGRVYSIGVDHSLAALEAREPAFGCRRLFPLGEVTFISDDVMMHYPQKASDIIETFLYVNKSKPEGANNSRIITRPGIKDWLSQLALESVQDRGRPDARYMQLYESLCKLCPPEDEDPNNPPNPLPTSNLISVPPEELPSFQGLWEEDRNRATEYMVNWFAGWSVSKAAQFRRFYVCYQPGVPRQGGNSMAVTTAGEAGAHGDGDMKGWSKQYQHLTVWTPDQWLERQKKK